jgi:hypothetical protein
VGDLKNRRIAMAGWWNHPAYRPIIMAVPAWREKKLLEEAYQRQPAFGNISQPPLDQWRPTSVPQARDVEDELEAELEELLDEFEFDDEFEEEDLFEEEFGPSAPDPSPARWFFGLLVAVGAILALGSLMG